MTVEELVKMLSCGNTTPQERIRWAYDLIAAAKEEERGKIRRWIEEDAPISDDGVPYSSLLSYLAPKEVEPKFYAVGDNGEGGESHT